jgi:membrane-associated phospholipid phosphatase
LLPKHQMAKVWILPAITFTGLHLFAMAFNNELFFAINQINANDLSATIWGIITQVGDGFVVALICILLLERFPQLTGHALIALLLSLVLVGLSKDFWDSPRPLSVFDPGEVQISPPPLYHRSFPSGHTTTATIFGSLLVLYLRTKWRFILGWVVLISGGISRIVVGAHFPVDVTAGFLLGLLITFISWRLMLMIPVYANWWQGKSAKIIWQVAALSSLPFLLVAHKPAIYYPSAYLVFSLLVFVLAARRLYSMGR